MPITKKYALFCDKKLIISVIMPAMDNKGAKIHAHKPNSAIAAPITPKNVVIAPRSAIIFAFIVPIQ